MPSRARDRQLAKLAAQRKAERAAAARRRRLLGGAVGIAAGVVVIVIGFKLVGGNGTPSASGSPTPSASAAPLPPGKPKQIGQITPGTPPGRIACDGQIPEAAATLKPTFNRAPSVKSTLDATKAYSAVVKTSCGTFEIALNADIAPQAVASFVFLARQQFFDGLTFHRIVPSFVIQTGDPTLTSGGGAGYSFGLEVDPALNFDHIGQVAMAHGGSPDSNGSQWFVTTGEASSLDQRYTIFGDVTSGLDVVKQIGAVEVGGASGDQPQVAVYVESVTIKESPKPKPSPTPTATPSGSPSP